MSNRDQDQLEVSEIFESIQGEGPSIGTPALFIRLRRCNLQCIRCDTKYTWSKTSPGYQQYTLYTPQALADEINASRAPLVVITGGEPLIWHSQIAAILPRLRPFEQVLIEIETNGTIAPGRILDASGQVCFNISPKLSSSGNKGLQMIIPSVLREYVSLGARESLSLNCRRREPIVFKFVVREDTLDTDVAEIVQLEADYFLSPIYLMPEGITEQAILSCMRQLVPVCKEYNWRLSPRLQILLWGNRRGT